MNKKQLTIAWISAILLCIVWMFILLNNQTVFSMLDSIIMRTGRVFDFLLFFIFPIIIISSLSIYTLRNKKNEPKNIQDRKEKTVGNISLKSLQALARREREKTEKVENTKEKSNLLNREQAEKIAGELLDKLEPEDYPKILALSRESAIRRIVDGAHVGNDQYEEGYLANTVLVTESDLSH